MLLVVPAAGDTEGGARRLAELGVPAYEARQKLLRGVPFTLAADVEKARGAAMELRALGVEAWAVDEDAWRRSPPLCHGKSFRLFPEGIEITTRPGAGAPAATFAVRWSDVELLLPARSVQSTLTEVTKTKKTIAMNPMKMMRGSKKSVDHVRDESEERFVLILAREPDLLARFDLEGTDYAGLGERRQPVARANYEAFVGLLRAGAPAARVDDRLEKLASRLSGAPAGRTASTSIAGMTQKVAHSSTEDNEGAVVAAARLLCLAERLRRAG